MEESITSFFEQWIQEFVRAVQMFTGESPTVSQKAADDKQIETWEPRLAEFHWWQQETEGSPAFKVWVGAEEASWTALGGGTEDGNDPKELFHEMLAQANQGSAAVLSASFAVPVRFQAGTAASPSSLRPLRLAQIAVKFHDASLPPLLIALEPAAAYVLAGPEFETPAQDRPAPPQSVPPAALAKQNPPMFDRLMDLQLPLSVVLGQAVLPIRDVLKIASGSVIELDRQAGDYVEVMVHGTVVARGEIVSIKGNYGVRIKEVISRKDRYALKDVA